MVYGVNKAKRVRKQVQANQPKIRIQGTSQGSQPFYGKGQETQNGNK